eukprot:TRINITY_DN47723_c0_g1_i1.p2 TRINITY_DN47723_c0_g1~~TRINITY_DN47723_c0_g1_i1.p2  ORF type:complete len:121 (+),score=14.52 TRINITY_DN47723_c0_g1_i1:125-487(+)
MATTTFLFTTGFAADRDVPLVFAMKTIFAIACAITAIGVVNHFKFTNESQECWSHQDGYAWNAVLRDLRSLISFALGCVACCVFVGRNREDGDGEHAEPATTGRSICVDFAPVNILALAW